MGYIDYTKFLTQEDRQKAWDRNKKNYWECSPTQLRYYGGKYRKAEERGDFRTMGYIEFILTDVNFHRECALLHNGEYEQFFEELKNW